MHRKNQQIFAPAFSHALVCFIPRLFQTNVTMNMSNGIMNICRTTCTEARFTMHSGMQLIQHIVCTGTHAKPGTYARRFL